MAALTRWRWSSSSTSPNAWSALSIVSRAGESPLNVDMLFEKMRRGKLFDGAMSGAEWEGVVWEAVLHLNAAAATLLGTADGLRSVMKSRLPQYQRWSAPRPVIARQ